MKRKKPATKKSSHKHQYKRYLQRLSVERDTYMLVDVCTICGRMRSPKFNDHIGPRKDGTRKWLITLEDFTEVYGDLPILNEKDEGSA